MTLTSDGTSARANGSVDEPELQRRLEALTVEQKAKLVTGSSFWTVGPEPAAGLDEMLLSDGPAGVRGRRWDERDTSANIPTPIALAATWDRQRLTSIGELLAAEAQRKGVDVLLAPAINLHRSPLGGRTFEYLSEDPVLTGELAVALVDALQSHGVAATVKHLVANDSETERFTFDARIDTRTLHELYLAPFRDAVAAGAWAVMAAYNLVNGVPMTENDLLNDLLRGTWDFDGVTMSDWYAVRSVIESGNGGLDLAMPGPASPWANDDALLNAVRSGAVDLDALDEKVRRILRLAARVGKLDGFAAATASRIDLNAAEISLRLRSAAADGLVLLKNDGEIEPILPLRPRTHSRLAVIGPGAASGRTLGGGSATVYPSYIVSPLDGIAANAPESVLVDHVAALAVGVRHPLADWRRFATPEGEAGVETRFIGHSGEVLGAERRQNTLFKWLGDFMPGVSRDAVDFVEVHATLNPPVEGQYLLGVSGLGDFRLEVDGQVIIDEELALAEGGDPIEGLIRPPQLVKPIDLQPGQPISVVVRHPVIRSSATTKIELNLTEPGISEEEGIRRAVDAARNADTAIVVVGTNAEIETESMDRATLALPGRQDELVRRVAEVNPRTVVVINAGAPVLMPWLSDVAAVIVAWFPGQEFGNALADVIFGQREPGGRLPLSWPATDDSALPDTTPHAGEIQYSERLDIGYRSSARSKSTLFPFGFGLGYTNFQIEDLNAATIADDAVQVLLTVTNTGRRVGKFVGQLYASANQSKIERPDLWLVAFDVAQIAAGETTELSFTVPISRLKHFDTSTNSFELEDTEFTIAAGMHARNLSHKVRVRP